MGKRKRSHRIKRRKQSQKCRSWVLYGYEDRHHDFARTRGGKGHHSNLFCWDRAYHEAFHFLFKNRTLLEAARWLEYIHDQNQEGIKINIGDYDEAPHMENVLSA